jgi:hypothetical protein
MMCSAIQTTAQPVCSGRHHVQSYLREEATAPCTQWRDAQTAVCQPLQHVDGRLIACMRPAARQQSLQLLPADRHATCSLLQWATCSGLVHAVVFNVVPHSGCNTLATELDLVVAALQEYFNHQRLLCI